MALTAHSEIEQEEVQLMRTALTRGKFEIPTARTCPGVMMYVGTDDRVVHAPPTSPDTTHPLGGDEDPAVREYCSAYAPDPPMSTCSACEDEARLAEVAVSPSYAAPAGPIHVFADWPSKRISETLHGGPVHSKEKALMSPVMFFVEYAAGMRARLPSLVSSVVHVVPLLAEPLRTHADGPLPDSGALTVYDTTEMAGE